MEVFNDRIDGNNFEHISHFTHFSSVFIVDFEQVNVTGKGSEIPGKSKEQWRH